MLSKEDDVTQTHRDLGGPALAALLVSAHYGLGFLLGTGERAVTAGFAGSVYGVSIALGTCVLLGLARFYWQEVEQLWTILGDRYGEVPRLTIAIACWASLVGVEAVQIISGASILSILGWPLLPTALGLAVVFAGLSLLPIARLSGLFRGLLAFNVAALLFALVALQGVDLYLRAPVAFWPAAIELGTGETVGISLTTIMLVLVDMKYHQFLVRARDLGSLYRGCTLAAGILFALALLPAAVVMAALRAGILPAGLESKAVVPYILTWLGGGATQPLGILLAIAAIVPALGVGSSVLRLQTKTVMDFKLLPDKPASRGAVAAANGLLAIVVALKGASIVGTMVCFYAVYASVVWVPFGAHLWRREQTTRASARNASILGGAGALSTLVLLLFWPQFAPFGRPELGVIATGTGLGAIGLFGTQMWEAISLSQRGLSSHQ